MKQLVVLSGKGGTGKTTVAAALAHLASQERPTVLADADVDAANLELVLAPSKQEEHEFVGGQGAFVDRDLCIGCDTCRQVCRFDAVLVEEGVYRVDDTGCEGCAACFYQCPADAIEMRDRTSGLWFRSETPYGTLFHAHLFAGQENSGKLVSVVKQNALVWSVEQRTEYMIVDGPPGIGCPVIAACAGAQLAVLVVEPTVSGIHDLGRVLATTDHFQIPAAVIINKCDVNAARTDEIAAYCAEHELPLVGRIPFDTVVTEAMLAAQPVTAYSEGPIARELAEVWSALA